MLRLLGFLMLVSVIWSCSQAPVEAVEPEMITDTITKEDTLGWAGIYKGTVPDANSIGLEMILELFPSNTYNLKIVHLQKDPKNNTEQNITGDIVWEEDSTIIVLNEVDSIYSNKFRINAGNVELLNPDATPNTGNLSEFYVLKKN